MCADDCVFSASVGTQQRDPAAHQASPAFVVFNRFWTIMELYNIDNEDIAGFGYTQYLLGNHFIVGF